MQDMGKEQWIDGIINSTEGMQRAQPAASVLHRIEQHLGGNTARVVPLRTVSLAAASILLLVMANLFVIKNRESDIRKTGQSSVDVVIDYYGLDNNKTLYR